MLHVELLTAASSLFRWGRPAADVVGEVFASGPGCGLMADHH